MRLLSPGTGLKAGACRGPRGPRAARQGKGRCGAAATSMAEKLRSYERPVLIRQRRVFSYPGLKTLLFFCFFFGCWIVLCAHVFISVIMSDDCSWTSWWKCWSRWSACRGSEKADGSENSLYCTLLCFMILDYTLLYFFIVCVAFFAVQAISLSQRDMKHFLTSSSSLQPRASQGQRAV